MFGNGLKLGHSGGRADLGSVQFDGNFSLSFWVKPESVDANASVLLSKEGISNNESNPDGKKRTETVVYEFFFIRTVRLKS